jgi:hypothetical protein
MPRRKSQADSTLATEIDTKEALIKSILSQLQSHFIIKKERNFLESFAVVVQNRDPEMFERINNELKQLNGLFLGLRSQVSDLETKLETAEEALAEHQRSIDTHNKKADTVSGIVTKIVARKGYWSGKEYFTREDVEDIVRETTRMNNALPSGAAAAGSSTTNNYYGEPPSSETDGMRISLGSTTANKFVQGMTQIGLAKMSNGFRTEMARVQSTFPQLSPGSGSRRIPKTPSLPSKRPQSLK